MNDVTYRNCKLHDLSVDEEKRSWFQTNLVLKGTWRKEMKGEEWETEGGKGSSGKQSTDSQKQPVLWTGESSEPKYSQGKTPEWWQ